MGGGEEVREIWGSQLVKVFHLGSIAKVVKRGFDDLADKRLEGEGGVKDHRRSCGEGETVGLPMVRVALLIVED